MSWEKKKGKENFLDLPIDLPIFYNYGAPPHSRPSATKYFGYNLARMRIRLNMFIVMQTDISHDEFVEIYLGKFYLDKIGYTRKRTEGHSRCEFTEACKGYSRYDLILGFFFQLMRDRK